MPGGFGSNGILVVWYMGGAVGWSIALCEVWHVDAVVLKGSLGVGWSRILDDRFRRHGVQTSVALVTFGVNEVAAFVDEGALLAVDAGRRDRASLCFASSAVDCWFA